MPRKPGERSINVVRLHNGFILTLVRDPNVVVKQSVATAENIGEEILGLFEVKPRERKVRVVRKKAAQEAAAG
jgi:hypothetical protein